MIAITHHLPYENQLCFDAADAEFALKRALLSIGASLSEEVHDFFKRYCERRLEQRICRYDDTEFFKRLLFQDEVFRFGTMLSEYLALVRIVGDLSGLEQDFEIVEKFRNLLNTGLLQAHPQSRPLNAQSLMSKYRGRGIKVVVFDLFDSDILNRQRLRYPNGIIHEIESYGRPVSMDHGNSVIDFILGVAPDVEIFPVSSDTNSIIQALDAIIASRETLIVNMSRPLFMGKASHLDPQFKRKFEQLIHSKIVVKSLGNSGTDLLGNVSQARRELGLGATGDLGTYDVSLIQELVEDLDGDYLFLAQNWKIDGKSIALSATIAGDNNGAASRTIGAPADGIYSFATSNFESGSSFAAPQITGILTLLLEAQDKRCSKIDLTKIVDSLRTNGKLVDGDAAYQKMLGQAC